MLTKLINYKVQIYLIFLTFITAVGTYFVTPFIAIYMTESFQISSSLVGIVLSVQVLASRGLMMITGPLADRTGSKSVLLLGLTLIGISYAGYAMATNIWLFIISILLGGLGVALFQPSSKNILVNNVDNNVKNVLFGWRNILFNSGVAVGSGLGVTLIKYVSYSVLFTFAAFLYMLIVLLSIFFIPKLKITTQINQSIWKVLAQAFRNKQMLVLFICSIGFWFLYTQMTITIPLTFKFFGDVESLGLFFTLNAILAICIQYPIIKWANQVHLTPMDQFNIGILCVGLGLVSLIFLPFGVPVFIIFLIIFTLGEVLASPNLDAMASILAKEGESGAYFGVIGAGWAIGGILGNIVGGFLFDIGVTVTFTFFGLAALVLIIILKILFMVIDGNKQKTRESEVQK